MTRGNQGHRFFLTGARLALLAIALQLVLTFGHVHPLPSFAAVQQIEAHHDPVPGSDDGLVGDCAICGSIAAFSTLDVPQADAALSAPKLLVRETLKPHAVEGVAALAGFPPFNPRAPPSA